jgi:tetratricopeptide (TPR) repeat protein
LPGFIAKQLQEQADTLTDEETRSNAQFQLAVCHTIGFGVRRSLEHSRQWLSACGKSDEDLEAQIEQVRAENRWPYQNQRVKALETAGSLDLLDPRFLQDAAQILKNVELHYREQLQDFQHVFDPAHSVIVLTRYLLGNVLNKAGRYEEAYRLYLDLGKIMEGGELAWGPLHRSTLITWTQAAGMALKMGKNAEAESLYLKAL